jgi:hypothetical protein
LADIPRRQCVIIVEPSGCCLALGARKLVAHFMSTADFTHPLTRRRLLLPEILRTSRRMRASAGLTRTLRATHLFAERIRDHQRSSESLVDLLVDDCARRIDSALTAAESPTRQHPPAEERRGSREVDVQMESVGAAASGADSARLLGPLSNAPPLSPPSPGPGRLVARLVMRTRVEEELGYYDTAFDVLLGVSLSAAGSGARHHHAMYAARHSLLDKGLAWKIKEQLDEAVERTPTTSISPHSWKPAIWMWLRSLRPPPPTRRSSRES